MSASRVTAFAFIATSPVATGCTTLEISGAAPRVEHRFGLLRIEPAGGSAAIVVRSRGFGLVPSGNGLTLGYSSETTAYFYRLDQCRIVLFPRTPDEVSAFASSLRLAGTTPAEICDVSQKEQP